jgi:uncharacterized protein (DUF2267 family)
MKARSFAATSPPFGEEITMARSAMTEQDRYENLRAEISGRSGASPERARAGIRAVLCVLGQRISSGALEKLLSALPRQASERVKDCTRGRHEAGTFGRDEFLSRVAEHIGDAETEPLVRAVFGAVVQQIPEDVSASVANQLPKDLRELWRAPEITETVDRYGVFMADLAAVQALPAVMLARAAEAVLCTLEKCLPEAQLGKIHEELPEGLLALVKSCKPHRGQKPERMGREEFLRNVGRHLDLDGEDSEHVSRAVLAAVRSQLSEEEIRAVAGQLPDELRELWQGEVILERFDTRI